MSVMNTRHCCPLLWMEMPVEHWSPQDGFSPFSRGVKLQCALTQAPEKQPKGTARGEHRSPDSAEKGVKV